MQVDPIKPTMKAPGPKLLKVKCDELLSTSPFKFNVRRFMKVVADKAKHARTEREELAGLRQGLTLVHFPA